MVLTLHHLGISQSERIVFLLEELQIQYELVTHVRDPILAPQSLKDVPGNSTGQAPFLVDPDAGITLSESGAICEYIMEKYKGADTGIKLKKNFPDAGYIDYIYWFHWANAGLQPSMMTAMFFGMAPLPDDDRAKSWVVGRMHGALQQMDDRLKENKWLAGEDFTAADCLVLYSLTTQRYYGPMGYEKYPNIVRYLGDIGEREGYQRAMEKGDPEMKLLLGVEAPGKNLIVEGGVKADFWKK
jgi:glutathione S-transferase